MMPSALAAACALVFGASSALAATQDATATDAPTAPAAARSTAPTTSTPAPSAVVQQPRPTGYFVGDILTQRVLLERDGRSIPVVTPPTPSRVSAWFERRSTSIETDTSAHRWLVVQYQILNAPSKLVAVTLPAWTLASRGAETHAAPGIAQAGGDHAASAAAQAASNGDHRTPPLHIPAASINIAPLSPPGSPTQVGATDLRPDRFPPPIATAPLRRDLELSAGALGLTLVAWLGWIAWRNRRTIATQPFAIALREMRSLDDREPRAWQALHRAFDRTAGRVIQRTTLPTLFERAPQLTPMRAQIEQFFSQSSEMFFASANTAGSIPTAPAPAAAIPSAPATPPAAAIPSVPATPPAAPIATTTPSRLLPRALCAELSRIERRTER